MGKLCLLVFFLFATSLANGQETNQLSGLDAEIEALQQLYNAVGLSVAVVKNDSIIYSKGFGYRDLENQLPVTTHTVFNIGSITKHPSRDFRVSKSSILKRQTFVISSQI